MPRSARGSRFSLAPSRHLAINFSRPCLIVRFKISANAHLPTYECARGLTSAYDNDSSRILLPVKLYVLPNDASMRDYPLQTYNLRGCARAHCCQLIIADVFIDGQQRGAHDPRLRPKLEMANIFRFERTVRDNDREKSHLTRDLP